MTTIAHNAGVIIPTIVDGYQASRPSRSILHPILGRPDDDVTFRPAGMRRGTLTLIFAAQAQASAAAAVLSTPQVLTLSDPDIDISMSFVVADDDVVEALEDETRKVWFVEMPFREVVS